MGRAAGLSSWARFNPQHAWLPDGRGTAAGMQWGQGSWWNPSARPPLPALAPSAGPSLWWPWRIFLVARLGVLCPRPVCLVTVEPPERLWSLAALQSAWTWGLLWEGSSDRL